MTSTSRLPGSELYFLLSDAARLSHQAIEQTMQRSGVRLTPAELRALVTVANHDGSRQKTLAGHIGIEPMTLSSIMERLETLGLITRTQDPTDRRAKIIRLTPSAQGLFEALSQRSTELFETVIAGVEPDRVAGALEVLTALRRNLHTGFAADAPVAATLQAA